MRRLALVAALLANAIVAVPGSVAAEDTTEEVSVLTDLMADCGDCVPCLSETNFKGEGEPPASGPKYVGTGGDCAPSCIECPPDEEEDEEDIEQLVTSLMDASPSEITALLRLNADRLAINPVQQSIVILGGCTGDAIVAEVPMSTPRYTLVASAAGLETPTSTSQLHEGRRHGFERSLDLALFEFFADA